MLPDWNKIAIIKLRAIGDVILTTPVFHNLREQFPEAQIDFITEKAAFPLVKNDKYLDQIFIAPKGEDRKLRNDWRFLKKIRQQKYEVCIDLFGNPRSAIITFLSGAKLRVGFNFRGRKYLYHVRLPSRAAEIHEVDFNLDVLKYYNIPVQNRFPQIFLDSESIKRARVIFSELQFTDYSIVVFNPAGSWPSKKWPLKHFSELANKLHSKYNFKFLILWGPCEFDEAEKLAKSIGENAKLHPETNLIEQAALLSLCDLYIGNDTGPMHMATAVGTPTIGLLGPTNAKLQGPFGLNAKAVINPDSPCLGCDLLECPLGDCMNDLKPEMVLEVVEDFIKDEKLNILVGKSTAKDLHK